MPSLTNQQTASPGPLNNNKRGFWAKKFPDTRKERSDRWQVIASALFLSNDLRQKKRPDRALDYLFGVLFQFSANGGDRAGPRHNHII